MRLPHDTYVDLIRSDAGLLATAADRGLEADVPSCPGWTVRDVVEHVAEVYLHKVACMREKAFPQPWPPERDETPTPAHFAAARDMVLAELAGRDPDEFAATWWWDERTVGFWGRRMAHETAIHRVDAELAHGDPAPIDEQLALDGVDEVLRRFLAGDWSDEPFAGPPGTVVRVHSGDESWRIVMEPSAIVAQVDRWPNEPAHADITGDPVPLYLWLWRRGSGDSLTVDGDPGAAELLHERLGPATQ